MSNIFKDNKDNKDKKNNKNQEIIQGDAELQRNFEEKEVKK